EDHVAPPEQFLEPGRLDARGPQLAIGQPRVERADRAAERLQEALQRAGDRAEPDEADGAAEEEEAVRVPRMAPALVAAPHRPVAGRDLAARGERQGERHLRN